MNVASAPDHLIPQLLEIVERAGDAILEIYNQGAPEVSLKEDRSPLTAADLASHRVLVEGLSALTPEVPVLSEESASIPWEERRTWDRFWLVDPLDGTKEFIRRNGEFTVNVAWIEHGQPTLGVVGVPVQGRIFFGGPAGAYEKKLGENAARPFSTGTYQPSDRLRVVASRSHPSPAVEEFLERLDNPKRIAVGSSLKLILVALGEADLYPRLGPTMEWDIGAAQAVLAAAGGLIHTVDKEPLTYNKENQLNPWFIAQRPGVAY